MAEVVSIKAKIAQIVSSRELAFNAGSKDGVHKGDTVTLYRNVEITDPDSKELLGSVLVPHLNLVVTLVDEKFCVARVTDTVSDNIYALSFGQDNTKKVSTSYQGSDSDSSKVVVVKIGAEATIRHVEKKDV